MSTRPAVAAIAYLGPQGSYTEQAMLQHYAPERTVACYSTAEVFRMLRGGEVPFGFVAMENSLQGPVSETLDLLFEHNGAVQIRASVVLRIAHCLGVLPGAGEVRHIYAHEQALRQCSRYLRANFPQAELHAEASNSRAAERVLESKLADAAVIASKETLLARGFVLLAESIADEAENFTRFGLLSRSDLADRLLPEEPAGEHYVTSIVVDPGRDRQGLLYELLEVISVEHRLNLLSIHSRPDRRGGFVFHLDLEGSAEEPRIASCLQALREYCLTHTGSTAQIIVCGSYLYRRFQALPFRTVGIIGGDGVMGRWFARFLKDAGFDVTISDPAVPSASIEEVAAALGPKLKPGQLVVENCSIKGCVLPVLLASAAPGVEVLGVHTMFAGDVETLRGENVLITRTERFGARAQAFEDLFYKFGARLTYADADEHDRAAATVQSVVHLAALAVGQLFAERFEHAARLHPFNTVNSRAALQIVQRVIGQQDELLFDLQLQNDESAKARHRLLEVLFELVSSLDQAQSFATEPRVFRETLERIRRFLRDSPP